MQVEPAAALPPEAAAVAGRFSIIPLNSAKKPVIASWRQYQEVLPAPAELARWAKTQPPAWAVLTGHLSRLVVLDFDGQEGADLAARWNIRPHVRTGSGGLHWYVEHPGHKVPTLNCKADKELAERWPGLDTRGDGGYAAFCGHNQAGPYVALRELAPDPWEAVPADLRDFLRRKARLDTPAAPAATNPAWLQAKLGEAIQRSKGGRNAAGFWLALQLRDEGLSEGEAAAYLRVYAGSVGPLNQHGQREPYTEAEALASLRQAYRTARREPARNPARPAAPVAHQVSQSRPPAAVEDNGHQEPPPPRLGAGRPAKEPRKCLCTDLGNAERLVLRHGRNLRYSHPWKKWLVWDGRRWQVDDSAAAERAAYSAVRLIWDEAKEASKEGQEKDAERLGEWASKSQASGRIRAMLELAKAWPEIAILPDTLDLDPYLLNCQNGTLDLRTGAMKKHERADLITKLAPVDFDALADAPAWLAFLDSVMCGRAGLVSYLQRAMGYSLTGDVTAKQIWVCFGGGDNGKTTLLETYRAMMGDYAGSIPIESLLQSGKRGSGRDPNPEIAALRGLRFVTTSEADDGARLNEALLKHLTGMATIQARNLYGDFFSFPPTHKIWLDTNYRPAVKGQDKGIWTRLRLVPFELQLAEAQKDRTLMRRLRDEAAGILTWAVMGALDWQSRGFEEPAEVAAATADYRAQMDTLGAFLEECTEPFDQEHYEAARDLYKTYHAWASGAGEHPMSERRFAESLSDKGIRKVRATAGFRYHGLRLVVDLTERGEIRQRRLI